jgi:DNA mismatch repair protein MutS
VPHHAARNYVARLTELGHKVAICEQVEDPKLAKGLVRREVVRIVTPGVVVDEESLDPGTPRYVAAISFQSVGPRKDAVGLAYLDVTTGEFRATELASVADAAEELARVAPREVLADPALVAIEGPAAVLRRYRATWTAVAMPERAMAMATLAASLAEVPDADTYPLAVCAAAAVLSYARDTQPSGALPVARLALYDSAATVVLDEAAIANLELVQTFIGGRRDGSLLAVLDETATSPGARLLRRWLLYPLTDVSSIRRRLDAVEWLFGRPDLRRALRVILRGVADLERLAGKATLAVAQPRDLGRVRDSLILVPEIAKAMRQATGPNYAASSAIDGIPARLDFDPVATPELAELAGALARALCDQPPALAKDGGLVRAGYDAIVDECRRLADGGKDAILAIEVRERERSGIASLKVRYNRVFGYYIEITKSHLGKVPSDYLRKQTVATGERFVTAELAELETRVLAAEETLLAREAEIHGELCAQVAAQAQAVIAAGAAIAELDVVLALADVAERRGFNRPSVDDGLVIDIVDGRHPVVESMVPAGTFVPNDAHLDADREQLVLVTGPNMAGKSTYMRQVAQIVLLAQMGSFVPAGSAHVGVCDRLFTRVGAADNLARGDSTFMVEMRETGAILVGATRRSLLILDEVGRGTSTYDGVSIAWAVAEYLHDAIGARTLFATHYHELIALAESRSRVRNVSAQVREHKGDVVFLRRIAVGGANRSYGIDVARLAGLPRTVTARARQILGRLETGSALAGSASAQLSLLSPSPQSPPSDAAVAIIAQLRSLDIDQMTPMAALALLVELQQSLG